MTIANMINILVIVVMVGVIAYGAYWQTTDFKKIEEEMKDDER